MTAALAIGALLLTGAPASAAPTSVTEDPVPVSGEACADGEGVTVVVDFPAQEGSEGVGEVVIGCAPTTDGDADMTGTEALQAAGFTDTRDGATMVCAIDGYPDPCPTEFTGDWWSYWYADADADASADEWQQYQEGSDTVATQDGRVEGWRYFDGSEGPRVDPSALAEALASAPQDQPADDPTAPEDEATEGAEPTDDATEEEPAQETEGTAADAAGAGDDTGTPAWVWFAGGLVVLALVVLAVNAMRRSPHGPPGQD